MEGSKAVPQGRGVLGAIPQDGGVSPQAGGVIPQDGGVSPQAGGVVPQRGGTLPQAGGMTEKFEFFKN